jgi:hypothetical protein
MHTGMNKFQKKKKKKKNKKKSYEVWTYIMLQSIFIFNQTHQLITINSTFKATCFGPIGPLSGLIIRTGSVTASTFWDPKMFT